MSGANLAGLLDGPARWGADRPAVVVGDRTVRTWAQLAQAVARRAAALRDRHGIGPGDPVALFAANHPAYLEVLFAIWHAGAVAVPISSRLHAREAADILDRSHARLCFATADVADELLAHVDGAPVVVLGESDDEALLAAGEMAPVARLATDEAWIFFTSGTTGPAKGARLTHHNLFAMAAAYMADAAEVGPDDAIIHVAALSHASGLMCLPFVARGGAQVLPPSGGFDATELFDLVAAGERSSFFVPPTLLRRLAAHPGAAAVPQQRLATILVGAAPVLPSDLRDAVGAFGPCVWNGYGQGESPCTITAHSKAQIGAAVEAGDEHALRSVGVARAGMRVRVVDGDDQELGPGEVGEVVADGPTVMAGYLDLPDASAEALRGGWLHTGDVGTFDDRGRLTLVDRVKDVVITGGYNVYPREVEDVLHIDPAVGEAAVVGLPDAEWGERIVAFVVPAAGARVDEEALDRRCLDAIARHKRPKEYRVVDELPRNAAGKVLKKQLREMAAVADA
ncbi:MAG: long-chain acyl-CoA synthetase [Solirubrobacteraceae bacterium]|nr:long-chain acyl-CoA synthetase [Solirubrobacteraceae bacterium]